MQRFPLKNIFLQVGRWSSTRQNKQIYNFSKESNRQLATESTILPETPQSDDLTSLINFWPELQKDVNKFFKHYDYKGMGVAHFNRVMDYNVPAFVEARFLSPLYVYKKLSKDHSHEKMKEIQVLIWCNKLIEAFINIQDDIMDRATTRYGRPSWYMLDDIKLASVNDSMLVHEVMYYLVNKHFCGKSYYSQIVRFYNETALLTVFGQTLDNSIAIKNVLDYNMELYKTMIMSKSTAPLSKLPILSAMYVAQITDPKVFQKADAIIDQVGFLYMVQNDFLDIFGDTKLTGKIGTDIQKNTLAWFAVMVAERGNQVERKILAENYGSSDPVRVERVKKLFKDMGLIEEYRKLKEDKLNELQKGIDESGVLKDAFQWVVDSHFRVTPYHQ